MIDIEAFKSMHPFDYIAVHVYNFIICFHDKKYFDMNSEKLFCEMYVTI